MPIAIRIQRQKKPPQQEEQNQQDSEPPPLPSPPPRRDTVSEGDLVTLNGEVVSVKEVVDEETTEEYWLQRFDDLLEGKRGLVYRAKSSTSTGTSRHDGESSSGATGGDHGGTDDRRWQTVGGKKRKQEEVEGGGSAGWSGAKKKTHDMKSFAGVYGAGDESDHEDDGDTDDSDHEEAEAETDAGCLAVENRTASGKIWHRKYLELVKFKKKFGHLRFGNLPTITHETERLRTWTYRQRSKYRLHMEGGERFPQDRIDALNDIGFDWRLRQNDTSVMTALTTAASASGEAASASVEEATEREPATEVYRSVHGSDKNEDYVDANKSTAENYEYVNLDSSSRSTTSSSEGGPVARPRPKRASRRSRSKDEEWQQRLAELLQYRADNGSTNVPEILNGKEVPLGVWLKGMRKQYWNFVEARPSSLDDDKIALLNDVGVDWNAM
mmetsp:Transcript_11458/g.25671  ORF Transcript_11458/g.25671 Transcript_11458/m.25671 type:complete len:441 (-) Transcript_11458:175-1497(-)